jgi:AcrR family transcriptional regulator
MSPNPTIGGAENATRSTILAAAAQCFDQFSTERTTVEDIAKASKLSRPTIYRHFANKDEIVQGVSLMKSEEISRRVAAGVDPGAGARERIAQAMMISIEFLAADRQTREMLTGPFQTAVAQSGSRAHGVPKSLIERWTPILSEAMADGTLRPDLDLPTTISWLSDIQMLMVVRKLTFGETREDMRAHIEMFVLDGIARRPQL